MQAFASVISCFLLAIGVMFFGIILTVFFISLSSAALGRRDEGAFTEGYSLTSALGSPKHSAR